jgi:predicted PurR-regulated permease PerM
MPKSAQTVTISYTSIIRVLVVFLAVFFVYLIRDALALLFVAVIFAAAVDPWVDWLQKKRIPRAISILLIYVILLAVFSLVIIMMIPPITEEIGQIVTNFPSYYEKISVGVHSLQDRAVSSNVEVGNDSIVTALESLSLTLAQTTKSIFVTITSIFGGLFSLLIVLVITFYLTVEEDALKKFIKLIVPSKHRSYTMNLIERMQLKIGMWLRGQLLLSLIVGILTYFLLAIFGVKYALLLALCAGLLEIIPYLGPWLAGIPAVLVAFSDSFTKVIIVIAIYLFIQQFENNVIVPKLMSKMVGLNPIIVIMAILIGIKLGGVIGGLLGVPVAAAIAVYFSDIIKDKNDGSIGLR